MNTFKEGGMDRRSALGAMAGFALAGGLLRPDTAHAAGGLILPQKPDFDKDMPANPANPPHTVEGGKLYVYQGDIKHLQENGEPHSGWNGEPRVKRVVVVDGDCYAGTKFDTRNGVDIAEFHYSVRDRKETVLMAYGYAGHVVGLGLTNTGETGQNKYTGVRLATFNGAGLSNSMLIANGC